MSKPIAPRRVVPAAKSDERRLRDAFIRRDKFYERDRQLDLAIKRQDAEDVGYFIGSVLRILFMLFVLLPWRCLTLVFEIVWLLFEHIQAILTLFLIGCAIGFIVLIAYLEWFM